MKTGHFNLLTTESLRVVSETVEHPKNESMAETRVETKSDPGRL